MENKAARPLLEVRNLKVHFSVTKGFFVKQKQILRAVDGLSFSIPEGTTLGLVGESGCGKSTTGRAILQLQRPTSGEVLFLGRDLCKVSDQQIPKERRHFQMIFQDPYASLNPRMTVGDAVGEPLQNFQLAKGEKLTRRVQELFHIVGLNPKYIRRYPHEFSGGQRQRVGIARAIALNPKLIIADEPISALDVSIQAQILNLMSNLQKEMKLTYLFISHDLAAVRHISDTIAVMYLGRIMEIATYQEIYNNPLHPYTQALLSACPIPDPKIESKRQRIALSQDVPGPLEEIRGCPLFSRCAKAMSHCQEIMPPLQEQKKGHKVACHLYSDSSKK